MSDILTEVTSLDQAISVLIQGVEFAQKKGGVYSFQDSSVIYKSIEFIKKLSKENTEKERVKKDITL